MKENLVQNETVSLWSYLNSKKEQYLNFFYSDNDDADNILIPNVSMNHMRFWKEHFLYFSRFHGNSYNIPGKDFTKFN